MNEVTMDSLYDICTNHGDVMVVDVLNYLHRYMWVHRDLSVTIGDEIVNTGHLYGFTNFMIFLKRKFPNCAIILALDGIDKERRNINSSYKADRSHEYSVESEMDELLSMCSLVEGVYTCYDRDYEADDAIGVVARKISKLCIKNNIKKTVYILSNDKDMFQLVTSGTICNINIIRKFGSGKDWFENSDIVDSRKVREKFNGVAPEDLVKFRAIVGDSSDNLKGYYRFRKANAAIIAENFNYDKESKTLVLKEGVKPCKSWENIMTAITDDMSIFCNNYAIMELKTFDFELTPISDRRFIKPIGEIVGIIKKYKLEKYLLNVLKYSPYASEISKNV